MAKQTKKTTKKPAQAGKKSPKKAEDKKATKQTKVNKKTVTTTDNTLNQNKTISIAVDKQASKSLEKFPEEFPFWARLKISKNRTTLVIDEEPIIDKKTQKLTDAFVHRESIHINEKNEKRIKKNCDIINPNPDPDDARPMALKRPAKLPKKLFTRHNKKLNMPKELKEKYEKNNKKQ